MARVLVVDDDPGTLDTCEAVLRRAGYDVLKVASRAGALEVLERGRCDLLLADVKLPDGTGLDLLREVRGGGSEIPTVIMTGYRTLEMGLGLVDTAAEAIRLGAAAYLQKPVFDEDLVEAVRRGLGATGRASEIRANGFAAWGAAIVRVVDAPHDPRTVAEWARLVGVASDTLRGWCRTAGVSAKRSLDLARLLRAVRHARRRGGTPRQFLRVAEERTVQRLLAAGDLAGSERVLSLDELLSRQTLVTAPVALDELRATLREHGVDLNR